MPTLVIGTGLIGSQVARILVERGDKPVLMDPGAQVQAIGQIVDLAKVTLIAGDVLRPLSIIDALRTHGIDKIVHTAANPLLTLGAQKDPYAAINLNIMGTVNVLEAARVTGVPRVVVSSSSVLNHYLEGGADDGDFGKEEACRELIRWGADVSAKSGAGQNATGVAAERGHDAVAELLGRAGDVGNLWAPPGDFRLLPSSSRWWEAQRRDRPCSSAPRIAACPCSRRMG